MAITVIDTDGDLTVEVVEYDDQVQDGNGTDLSCEPCSSWFVVRS